MLKIRHLLLQKSSHAFILIHDFYLRKSSPLDSNFFVQKNQKNDSGYLTLDQGKKEGYKKSHINIDDANTHEKKHFQIICIENRIELNYELRAKAFSPVTLLCIHL